MQLAGVKLRVKGKKASQLPLPVLAPPLLYALLPEASKILGSQAKILRLKMVSLPG